MNTNTKTHVGPVFPSFRLLFKFFFSPVLPWRPSDFGPYKTAPCSQLFYFLPTRSCNSGTYHYHKQPGRPYIRTHQVIQTFTSRNKLRPVRSNIDVIPPPQNIIIDLGVSVLEIEEGEKKPRNRRRWLNWGSSVPRQKLHHTQRKSPLNKDLVTIESLVVVRSCTHQQVYTINGRVGTPFLQRRGQLTAPRASFASGRGKERFGDRFPQQNASWQRTIPHTSAVFLVVP